MRTYGSLDRCTSTQRVGPLTEGMLKEVLLRRARLLPPPERRLLEMSLAGFGLRCIARAAGMSPGSVSRRITRMKRRLRQPEVAALADFPDELPKVAHQLGVEHFLMRCGLKQLAQRFGLSRVQVAKFLGVVRGWAMLRKGELR